MVRNRVLCSLFAAAVLLLAAAPVPASAAAQPTVLAVMGDMPYGSAKVAAFPRFVSFVNSDPSLDLELHLGDIKAGSNSPCTNDYFDQIRDDFAGFQRPLVYTPGDNEWTDCHVAIKNNGLFTPTERLQKVRSELFPVPGQSLGLVTQPVTTQASNPDFSAFVENVMWFQSNVVFGTFNITGSNDDLDPWGTTLPVDAANYPSQEAERKARDKADLVWLATVFEQAERTHASGVVLAMQADMWDTTSSLNGYDAFVQRIGNLAKDFGKPVLLLEGDSHIFRVDHPFTPGDPLHSVHAKTPVAPNVTRLVVEGSNTVRTRFEYVRLTVDPSSAALFGWERVDFVF